MATELEEELAKIPYGRPYWLADNWNAIKAILLRNLPYMNPKPVSEKKP